MRKYYLFVVLFFLFATTGMAQSRSILLQESFDGTEMPEGWQITDQGVSNWSVSASNFSGGYPNEMKLFWQPSFQGISRLVTPAVDLTGINKVTFSFKHYLDNYSGTCALGIATSSDGGTTWHNGWTANYSQTAAYQVIEEIQTVDMGQPNVRFCVFFNGNTFDINNWYFDDIEIFTMENFDLGIAEISLPNIVPFNVLKVRFQVFNYGLTPVTSVEASCEIEGQNPVTETFAINLATMEQTFLEFSAPLNVMLGDLDITVRLLSVNGTNDDVPGNDILTKNVRAALGSAERIVMIESFSSSTCGPCVATNAALHTLCNNNPGRFAFTKFPAYGDAYYNTESAARCTYYNVVGVPQGFLDGENQGYEAVQQSAFDDHLARYAFMDIRGSFTMSGSVIHVKADVMPYIDEDARVFVSVNEKVTHNNTGSNGETEFYHVMMKMLPDADGAPVNFTAGELQHIEYEYDMSSTHVEEMSDLEVAVWVQNYESQEIYNCRFASEYTEAHPYPVENLDVVADDQVYCNCWIASWDEPSHGNPLGYNVFYNGELVAENLTDRSFEFEANHPDAPVVVEVQAVYADGNTSVKRVFVAQGVMAVGEDEAFIGKVYPNPSNGTFNLDFGQGQWDVAIYDLTGRKVYGNRHDGHSVIDLSQRPKGIYLLKAIGEGQTLTAKMVVR